MDNIPVPDTKGPTLIMINVAAYLLGLTLQWLKYISVHDVLANSSLAVSIVAALMAIRHYYLTDKKHK